MFAPCTQGEHSIEAQVRKRLEGLHKILLFGRLLIDPTVDELYDCWGDFLRWGAFPCTIARALWKIGQVFSVYIHIAKLDGQLKGLFSKGEAL